jgi:hypothetical protein
MKQTLINRIAGSMIIIGVLLGHFVNEYFYLIDAFVGVNLLQTSFTKWCLLGDILGGCGVKE